MGQAPRELTPDKSARNFFGSELRHWRTTRDLSQDRLGSLVAYSGDLIGKLEKAERWPTLDLASRCDAVLETGGSLARLWPLVERERLHESSSPDPLCEDGDVRRRQFVGQLGVVGLLAPLAQVEALRRGLDEVVAGHEGLDGDEWQEISTEYASMFYTIDPALLLNDLLPDLAAVQQRITASTAAAQRSMFRAGGMMAAIAAMAWASQGESRLARAWWRTARRVSDASADLSTQLWVRGWEVANGLYEHRPVSVVLDRASEAVALDRDVICPGAAGLYAGMAQTLATVGRAPEAMQALRRVGDLTERLPAGVTADDESMLGWPEVRLRHTESYVYTQLGDVTHAFAAQDRALALYPASLVRERAAMLQHRATCMIRDGDIGAGLSYSITVLDELPDEHRTCLVDAMAHRVMEAVPVAERRRPEAVELAERLELTRTSSR